LSSVVVLTPAGEPAAGRVGGRAADIARRASTVMTSSCFTNFDSTKSRCKVITTDKEGKGNPAEDCWRVTGSISTMAECQWNGLSGERIILCENMTQVVKEL